MSDSSWREELARNVRVEQIVVGALVAGALTFLVVAAVLVSQGAFGPGDEELTWIMNLVLALFLIPDIAARLIVPSIIVAQARRRILAGEWDVPEGPQRAQVAEMIERTGDAGRLMGVHATKTIVATALVEGVTFFAIIVYMVTQSMFALCVAIVMIAVLALHFPTRNGVLDWIESQLQLMEQERTFDAK
jgi:hypothetical protein